MDKGRKHIDLVGPTILIGIGVILLLNNLGILSWGVWEVVSLWPVLLVAAGLELLIGRRSMLGAFTAAIVVAALLAGAIWFVGISPTDGGRTPQAIEISEPLDDIEAARVTLAPAVGQINVDALDDSGNFVEGTIRYRRNERITQDFADGTTARLVVKTQGSYNVVTAGPGLRHAWNLSFNPAIELDLDTDMGIGDANLDLSGLAIDDVKVDFGIGEATIELPATGEFDVDVDGGIGSIIIKVPEGMELRVRTDTGIVGRDIPSSYSRSDDVYTSPGYGDAKNRANVTLGLGIGSVAIRETSE
jgi:hypothetical protein